MLKQIRMERGLSQSQLAHRANINIRTLQAYEQNAKDINGAKLDTLISLAAALKCSVRDILTNKELIDKCDTVDL